MDEEFLDVIEQDTDDEFIEFMEFDVNEIENELIQE